MSEERDIIERLKGVRAGTPLEVACEADDLCQEAADEIASLRARLKDAEARNLETLVDLGIMEAQLASAKKALEPFAAIPLLRDTYPKAPINRLMLRGAQVCTDHVQAARDVVAYSDEQG